MAVSEQKSLDNAIPAAATVEMEKKEINYAQRAQWLRAAVLGANDGLVSTSSLMMGVGAVRQDIKAMILTGFAGLLAGASSMAVGEFVSVYSQLEIEVAQKKRQAQVLENEEEKNGTENLPNPAQAALASALAFSVGAMFPLLGAVFIKEYEVRLGVVAGAASLALLFFGGAGAVLGGAPVKRSCLRILIGGWLAMAITFGLTKLIGTTGL